MSPRGGVGGPWGEFGPLVSVSLANCVQQEEVEFPLLTKQALKLSPGPLFLGSLVLRASPLSVSFFPPAAKFFPTVSQV